MGEPILTKIGSILKIWEVCFVPTIFKNAFNDKDIVILGFV
jgi:hypothetical protein